MCYDSESVICQSLPVKHGINMGYYTHFLIDKFAKLSPTRRFLPELLRFFERPLPQCW
jgi:hypothetical protein